MKKLSLLFIFISLIYSCSSQSQNLKKSTRNNNKQISNIEQVRRALDAGHEAVFVKDPAKWDLNDKNYIYAEGCQIKTTDLNPGEIISDLKGQVLTNLAEGLEITIESVFFSSLMEDIDGITDYKNSIIKTYSNAKFTSDDFELIISPQMEKIKNGVNICVKARLNKKQYMERLEREKKTNEFLAYDEFRGAKTSYDEGHMSVCINRLIKCKYYVDLGGGYKIVEYYRDSMQPQMSISSQLDELTQDVKKHLSFKFENHPDISQIIFKGRNSRALKVRVYSSINSIIDFQGVELEMVSPENGLLVKSQSSIDMSGYANFDLSGIPIGIEKVNFILRPSINLGILPDKEWANNSSYSDFMSKFHITQVGILYDPFPRNNLLSVITLSQDVRFLKLRENRLYTEMQTLLSDNSQYFNLLARGAGPPEEELKSLLMANSRLSKSHESQLSVCNMIMRLSIEKSVSQDFRIKSGEIKYDISLSLLAVDSRAFVVLGTTALEDSFSESDLLDGVGRLYLQFMDEYFYQTVEILTDKQLKHRYLVNGLKFESTKSQKSILITDVSRYHPVKVDIIHPDFRKETVTLSPLEFAYTATNKKSHQSLDIRTSKINLTPKAGTLRLITRDYDTGEILPQGMGYSPESKIWQNWFLFFPKNVFKSDSNNVVYKNLPPGNYTVMASQDGYTASLPSFKTIYDDLEVNEEQRLTIRLSEKSLLIAIGLSTLYPGLGHYNMDKPIIQYTIPAVLYTGAILYSWNRYNSYVNFKDEFTRYQDLYFSESAPTLVQQYKIDAQRSYDKMNVARTQLYLGIGSAVATNVLTNTMLMIQKRLSK